MLGVAEMPSSSYGEASRSMGTGNRKRRIVNRSDLQFDETEQERGNVCFIDKIDTRNSVVGI